MCFTSPIENLHEFSEKQLFSLVLVTCRKGHKCYKSNEAHNLKLNLRNIIVDEELQIYP